jgi:hypothetical protein
LVVNKAEEAFLTAWAKQGGQDLRHNTRMQ